MRNLAIAFRSNRRFAQSVWGSLSSIALRSLKELTETYALSVVAGDLHFLDGRWYVTHAGLLRTARRRRCSGIMTVVEGSLCDPVSNRWVFKAVVYRSSSCRGFVGYGDADPSNVSPLVRGAEMRVAETRAVNRALRKAYGIGLCSVEELGCSSALDGNRRQPRTLGAREPQPAPDVGQSRLRDRLCLLIRQHRLDPTLVKCYATEFCGTESLREASHERIQAFIDHLAEWAARDREGLLCHLNRYAKSEEAKP